MAETEENLRSAPQNELDMNLMLTNSVWGSTEVSPGLREILSRYYVEKDQEGQEYLNKRSMWELLAFFTRDMRLGNLSTWDNELPVCRYYIELASDFLGINMVDPFLISLSRAATILETSQSKRGFLRTAMNTLRQEHLQQTIEPPKRGFLGGSKKDKNNPNGGY